MGHNRNLADYAHHFDGTNIDLGSGNIETEGVVTYEDVTNVDSVGIITARAGVRVPDSQTVKMGTGGDLSIYHNGSNSHISNTTGGLYIDENIADGDIFLRADNGSGALTNYLFCDGSSGRVVLSHYGSGKIQTSSTGATVTGTLVSDGVTSELDLSAISSSISDTAVDVFVYDTRKDSDGGAWRKRTQHTSWYNETLGTATRGTRREFPAVAVIVAETTQLTIYDGDDPDLPMWMVFNLSGAVGAACNMLPRGGASSQSDITSVAFLNAKLVVGLKDVSGSVGEGLAEVNFISDFGRIYREVGSGFTGSIYNLPISGRNSNSAFSGDYDSLGIIAQTINDVAITVLPNAPIDDATGLPVLTIAVATDNGVSVIKDVGTVISTLSSSGGYPIKKVDFTDDHGLNAHIDSSSGSNKALVYVDNINKLNGLSYATYTNWDGVLYYSRYATNVLTYKTPSQGSAYPVSDFISMSGTDAAIGVNSSIGGLTLLEKNNEDPGQGMVAFVTSDYNTGYQQGDIKGAFLSDTDTTNVTASSAHYTETFTGSGDNTWGLAGGATISGGVLTLGNIQDSRATDLTAVSSLTTGQKYIAEIEIASNTSQVFNLDDDGAGASVGGNTIYGSCSSGSVGKFLIAFTKTASPRMRLIRISGGPATITGFKIYTAEEQDRSANNNGLKVFGTVTKSVVVATGAELVAYSNFSASNHLRQPPNSDMNIGTGDAYMMIWFKTTNASGTMMMMSYEGGVLGTNDYGKPFNIRYENGSVRGWASHDGFSTWDDVNHGVSTADGKWHCAAWVKRGKVFELYVDGEFIGSDTGSVGSNALSDANSELVIGARKRGKTAGDSEEPWNNGSLALARIGKSAPSAEQIKKTYEDEKVLFQENAKATIYGSSDAVTALSYDEDTELLHVGTSAGRSDFQGLRRINNTTTAVTTAISASDELIAEQ